MNLPTGPTLSVIRDAGASVARVEPHHVETAPGTGVSSEIKRIHTTGPTLKSIRDIGASLPPIQPHLVETALGAGVSITTIEETLAPLTLFAVREELAKRLQSSGGRPALAGTSRRAKIPLGDSEWLELEELAAAISSPGFAPSAGQVASVLLSLSLHLVTSQVSSPANPSPSPLAQGPADHTAAEL